MGYSGFTEYLCVEGHFSSRNVWAEDLKACPHCGKAFAHFHGVDQTNGYSEEHPSSCHAPKKLIGFTDVWNNDHYGNRYATKVDRWRPLEHWRPLTPKPEDQS